MGESSQPTQQQSDQLIGLFRAGRHREALAMARTLAEQHPTSPLACNIRGASARALGHLDEAEASFVEMESLDPNFAGAPYNLGLVLEDKGETAEAMAAYHRALAIDPALAQAHNNLGAILTGLVELDAALDHLETARQLRPELPEVHNSLGNALKRAERFMEALESYRQALRVQPSFVKARYNLGVLEQERGDALRAVEAFEKVLEQEPDHVLARSHLAYQLAQHCDWDRLQTHEAAISELGVTGAGVPPWPLLAVEDAPLKQLARARNWAKRRFTLPEATFPARPRSRPERLKIGYFSGDFHDHPSMHLMAGMLANHDRSRFEIHAFSYGEQHEDHYRRKARECVDHFHDVARQSDQSIIDLAFDVGIDIAIDRKGYSTGTRNQIFQHRLAPVQINYLGFAGSQGANFLDYIIADPVVIAPEHRSAIMEKVIQLPHCYLPADDQRAIAQTQTSRSDFGLPEKALVLCCFNSAHKIAAREFDIWMRVLGQIEGSVLWLYRSNGHVEPNLRKEAERRGIHPDRLIFAGRLPNPEHLARHKHADLFLDTFAYNAHTTCNDALWTGLPVVTLEGQQFAARVASSLLQAIGLEELVTHSEQEYESLILEIATDPARLGELKAKLAAQRLTAPLFNTVGYTRHFEAGLDAAYARFLDGLPPKDIIVPA